MTGQAAVCVSGAPQRVGRRECVPGQLMNMVAARLAARGFTVHSEDPEEYAARRLTVAGLLGMNCSLTVEDYGNIECEYVPHHGWKADPMKVARLVAVMLAGDSSKRDLAAGTPGVPGLPLRTVVGRELLAAGLDVRFDVYPDLVSFEVNVVLLVTNPDRPELGEICIDDDGSLGVEREYREDDTEGGIEEIADSVASAAADAIAKFNAAVYLDPACS